MSKCKIIKSVDFTMECEYTGSATAKNYYGVGSIGNKASVKVSAGKIIQAVGSGVPNFMNLEASDLKQLSKLYAEVAKAMENGGKLEDDCDCKD